MSNEEVDVVGLSSSGDADSDQDNLIIDVSQQKTSPIRPFSHNPASQVKPVIDHEYSKPTKNFLSIELNHEQQMETSTKDVTEMTVPSTSMLDKQTSTNQTSADDDTLESLILTESQPMYWPPRKFTSKRQEDVLESPEINAITPKEFATISYKDFTGTVLEPQYNTTRTKIQDKDIATKVTLKKVDSPIFGTEPVWEVQSPSSNSSTPTNKTLPILRILDKNTINRNVASVKPTIAVKDGMSGTKFKFKKINQPETGPPIYICTPKIPPKDNITKASPVEAFTYDNFSVPVPDEQAANISVTIDRFTATLLKELEKKRGSTGASKSGGSRKRTLTQKGKEYASQVDAATSERAEKPGIFKSKCKRKMKEIDLSDPKLMEPFKFGWIREVVYRGTNVDESNRRCDIYYKAPNPPKKLRSSNEVENYLTKIGSHLTRQNFCFFQEPMLLDQPDKEIVRNANLSVGRLKLEPDERGELWPVSKKKKKQEKDSIKKLKLSDSGVGSKNESVPFDFEDLLVEIENAGSENITNIQYETSDDIDLCKNLSSENTTKTDISSKTLEKTTGSIFTNWNDITSGNEPAMNIVMPDKIPKGKYSGTNTNTNVSCKKTTVVNVDNSIVAENVINTGTIACKKTTVVNVDNSNVAENIINTGTIASSEPPENTRNINCNIPASSNITTTIHVNTKPVMKINPEFTASVFNNWKEVTSKKIWDKIYTLNTKSFRKRKEKFSTRANSKGTEPKQINLPIRTKTSIKLFKPPVKKKKPDLATASTGELVTYAKTINPTGINPVVHPKPLNQPDVLGSILSDMTKLKMPISKKNYIPQTNQNIISLPDTTSGIDYVGTTEDTTVTTNPSTSHSETNLRPIWPSKTLASKVCVVSGTAQSKVNTRVESSTPTNDASRRVCPVTHASTVNQNLIQLLRQPDVRTYNPYRCASLLDNLLQEATEVNTDDNLLLCDKTGKFESTDIDIETLFTSCPDIEPMFTIESVTSLNKSWSPKKVPNKTEVIAKVKPLPLTKLSENYSDSIATNNSDLVQLSPTISGTEEVMEPTVVVSDSPTYIPITDFTIRPSVPRNNSYRMKHTPRRTDLIKPVVPRPPGIKVRSVSQLNSLAAQLAASKS